MWKWIGGIFVLLIVCIAGAIWAGYRKLTTAGDAPNVVIAAPPDRVFASLANHDSLASWWILQGGGASSGHGPLAVGDSLPVQSARQASRQQHAAWIVDAIVPEKLLTLSLRSDTAAVVIAVWRDSLVARGDSTELVSTITSPMMASFRGSDTGSQKTASGLIGASSKLLISAMKLQATAELTRLKSHIEGKPAEVRP